MSHDNVNILNSIYDAFERRDIATSCGFFSPEIDIIQCPQVPWGGTFHGLAGAEIFFARVASHINNRVTIERMIDGGDRVAVIGNTHGTVRCTGKRFEVPIVHLWTFQDERAVRLEIVIHVPAMQAALAGSTGGSLGAGILS